MPRLHRTLALWPLTLATTAKRLQRECQAHPAWCGAAR